MPVTINGTTGIAGVDGSAGTPSVQGTDTNTGMFFPAADTIAFSAGGTEDLRIGPAGQIGLQGANYGTSGQVFTSGGASAAPSWTTISVSPSGLLIRAPQILTSGTSYTTPSNCTKIYVEAVGGGASGANMSVSGATSGGGGGAYCAKYFTVTGSTAYAYAIGSGGASIPFGTNANGNNGGNTTFTVGATTITAGGGTGGSRNTSSANTFTLGGAGGTATNGDLNIKGSDGGMGLAQSAGTSMYFSGAGGGSVFSPVQPSYFSTSTNGPIANANNGYSGASYGGGGGGGTMNGINTAASGAGFQGMIRIWEFT